MADEKHVVVVGLNYTDGDKEKRAEPGDIVNDLPKSDLPTLLEQGIVRPLGDEKPAAAKKQAIADYETMMEAGYATPSNVPPPPVEEVVEEAEGEAEGEAEAEEPSEAGEEA